jgi:hypothetical protein
VPHGHVASSAEAKRREIEAAPATRESAKVVAMLPNMAEQFRRQLAIGLDDDPGASLRARAVLRQLIPGNIHLTPEPDGGLLSVSAIHMLLEALTDYLPPA